MPDAISTINSSLITNTITTLNAAMPDPTTASLPSWVLDKREAASIARRRHILQERAVRIHQPRNTSIAVDVEGLRRQEDERRQKKDEEKRQNEIHENIVAKQIRKVALIDHERNQEDGERKRQLATYWKEEQKAERRREYDLNSHEHVTSALYQLSFEGEDRYRNDRLRQQKMETDSWLKQQIHDKKQQLQYESRKQKDNEEAEFDMRERAKKLEETKINLCQAEKKAIQQYNIHLNRENKAKMEAEEDRKREEEKQEVKNAVWGALLTEDPSVSRSALGPHRIIPHRWKGMTEEQKEQIRNTREMQKQEAELRASEERRTEEDWKRIALRADRAAQLSAHAERIAARQRESELMKWNFEQVRSRRGQDIQTQDFTDEFYNKFGVHPR